MTQPEPNPEDRFIAEWKDWLQRPMRTQADEAAAHITAVLCDERRVRQPRRLALAAATALVCVAMISAWFVMRTPAPSPPEAIMRETLAPLGEGEILIWLDERTPLFMTFQLPDPRPGHGGKQ